MKSQGLAFFTDIHWTLVGLIIFFSLFIVLSFIQMRQYSGARLKEIESLPLQGEDDEQR